jgi:hypothetical protein
MYPHERSLVARLKDKPFALLGINSDQDRQYVKEVMTQQDLNWRSWWDGGGTDGPIARQWRVTSWPTIYVLDPKGVIRYKDVRGRELDEAVDRLLAEIESGKGS